MELENFFGNKHHTQKNYRDNRFHDSPRYSPNFHQVHQKHDSHFKLGFFLENLKNNRKLKLFVIFASILIIAIIVTLIAILLPIIWKLFNYISQNGLQGGVDYIIGFLDQLWKGSGK